MPAHVIERMISENQTLRQNNRFLDTRIARLGVEELGSRARTTLLGRRSVGHPHPPKGVGSLVKSMASCAAGDVSVGGRWPSEGDERFGGASFVTSRPPRRWWAGAAPRDEW
ncbi:hypothetical protein AB0G05_45070 [Nonomuraea wenchangensis]